MHCRWMLGQHILQSTGKLNKQNHCVYILHAHNDFMTLIWCVAADLHSLPLMTSHACSATEEECGRNLAA